MVIKMSDQVKRAALDYLAKIAKTTTTEPVFILGGVSHFAEDLIREISNDTEFGKMIIDEVIKTSVDMFIRGSR